GGEREDKGRGGGGREAHRGPTRWTCVKTVLEPIGVVDELHHGGDCRVELEAALEIPGHLVDRPVDLREQTPGPAAPGLAWLGPLGWALHVLAQAPEAGQEAFHSLNPLVRPVAATVRGAHEADVGPGGIRAVALDVLAGADDVAPRLRHLGAVAGNHALGEEV